MNINLHIDRLILDGVTLDPHQRPLLQQALQMELTRLLTSGNLNPDFAGGIDIYHLAAPGFQLMENHQPVQLGKQIAGAVYGGIGRE
jgi:hypothetical protein